MRLGLFKMSMQFGLVAIRSSDMPLYVPFLKDATSRASAALVFMLRCVVDKFYDCVYVVNVLLVNDRAQTP